MDRCNSRLWTRRGPSAGSGPASISPMHRCVNPGSSYRPPDLADGATLPSGTIVSRSADRLAQQPEIYDSDDRLRASAVGQGCVTGSCQRGTWRCLRTPGYQPPGGRRPGRVPGRNAYQPSAAVRMPEDELWETAGRVCRADRPLAAVRLPRFAEGQLWGLPGGVAWRCRIPVPALASGSHAGEELWVTAEQGRVAAGGLQHIPSALPNVRLATACCVMAKPAWRVAAGHRRWAVPHLGGQLPQGCHPTSSGTHDPQLLFPNAWNDSAPRDGQPRLAGRGRTRYRQCPLSAIQATPATPERPSARSSYTGPAVSSGFDERASFAVRSGEHLRSRNSTPRSSTKALISGTRNPACEALGRT